MLPLSSIRVLDLSRVLAGPYCTMMLGDLGAEVIKVERPGTGDDTRAWGPPFAAGESAYYLCCNRNKQSITINLKTERGRQLVTELADKSDVLVENFLPGQLAEWGLGYEALSQRNPGLIYCSLTGFGQTGPLRDEPGYDIMIQAMSGVMSITGEATGSPMKLGVAISDLTCGMFAANAILAALFARQTTGRGDFIDMALFDSTLAWLANVGSNYLVSGKIPQRLGTAHPNIVPYQAFAAADESLILAVGNDAQFAKLCGILNTPWAADPRFQTNAERVRHRDELLPPLAALLKLQPAAHWLKAFEAAGIPCGPVNTVDRALEHPQTQARGMVREVEHPTIGPLRVVGSPLHFGSQPSLPATPPPRLGEHTARILENLLGLTSAEVAALVLDKIV